MTLTYLDYIKPQNYVSHITFNDNLYRSIMPNGCYDNENKVVDIWKEHSFDWIICLCKKNEFDRKAGDTQSNIYMLVNTEYKCINFPIENYNCPSDGFDSLLILLQELKLKLDTKKKCVIHCSAGVGRTGLIIACYLVYIGKSVEEAINITKQNIEHALKHTIQLEYLKNFAECLSKYC